MSSDRRPWYKWYPKDFVYISEVQYFSDIEELIYRRLMDLIAISETVSFENNHRKIYSKIGSGLDFEIFTTGIKSVISNQLLFYITKDNKIHSRLLEKKIKRGWRKTEPSSEKLSGEEWMSMREKVFCFDNYTCQYCGNSNCVLECDHIIPKSRGGTDLFENLITACFSCNRSKSDRYLSEWLK